MNRITELNAETILFSVAACGASRVFGITNVLEHTPSSEYGEVLERSQKELREKKLASMDFNGRTTLKKTYQEILNACINTPDIIDVAIKGPHRIKKHSIIYLGESSSYIFKEVDEVRYEISNLKNDEVLNVLLELCGFPENTAEGDRIILDSGCLRFRNVNQFVEVCHDERAAEELFDSIAEAGRRTRITRLKGKEPARLYQFATGKNNTYKMKMEYSLDVFKKKIGKKEIDDFNATECVVFEPLNTSMIKSIMKKAISGEGTDE